jgi:hypothetical protein
VVTGRDGKRRKMKAKTLVIGGLVAAGGGALLLRRQTAARLAGNVVDSNAQTNGGTNGRSVQQDRWHAVTVNRTPEEVSSEKPLPGPLTELGDKIEVQIRPAPGDKGTEIAARVRGSVPSGPMGAYARLSNNDPRQALRKALRETKSLLETGEVLKPDTRPSTKPTPGGKLLGIATSRSWEEGRL